jgi:hypothetical protein
MQRMTGDAQSCAFDFRYGDNYTFGKTRRRADAAGAAAS